MAEFTHDIGMRPDLQNPHIILPLLIDSIKKNLTKEIFNAKEIDRVLVLYMTVVETFHKIMYSTHFTTLTMYYLNTEGIEISNLRRIMVGQKFQCYLFCIVLGK